ncbi:AraC family transcriptional regulator [Streptomyces sp. NBC_01477]|uniref:AraC family transcriptional regulator n=1 Tax=Streptomyces sp. NBC_01477 TaxID=2976015 RepID=UPI002E3542C5|nr:AraC family transcriptional regulator [Streptomyces sp. NBC_01477]
MDVLADALAAMRTGRTRSARTEVRAPWGLRFPAVGGATFHVVLEGECWLLPPEGAADEPAADAVRLGPGDAVFLRRGSPMGLADDPATALTDFVPHDWDPGETIGRVDIDGPGPRTRLLCGAYPLGRGRPHPLMAELPDILRLPPSRERHPALHAAIGLLNAELEERRPGRDGIVPALVDALLLYILRGWLADRSAAEAQGLARPGWATALTDPVVGPALEGIHADPGRAWTVEELAACGGLSRSAFAQRFTALVGTPPLTYLTWWRMTAAGRLLLSGDAPLRVVAEQVGYRAEFAFAKAFKREYGVAPGRYRRSAPGAPPPSPAVAGR